MLGMFSKKPNHPLAELADARRVVAEMARMDARAAVSDATAWLESLHSAEGFKLGTLLDRILMIEGVGAAQVGRMGRDFIHLNKDSRAGKAQWEAASRFWANMVLCLEDCVGRYLEGGRVNSLGKDAAALLLTAALHARAATQKWMQFHYRNPPQKFWQTSGMLYLTSVRLGLNQRTQELHAGHGETSVEAEYLKILLFHVAAMDTLQPMEIELGERLIARYLDQFDLVRDARPENVYWVDVAAARPPARLARLPQVSETLRFFNGAKALIGLNDLMHRIDSSGRVPGDVNLGGQYPPDTVHKVTQHLSRCWAPRPPMRSHTRRPIAAPVALIHGFDNVLETLAYAVATSRTKIGAIEVWSVTDISLGGMAIQGEPEHLDWPAVGALVAILPDGGSNWLVAIVRRVTRSGADADGHPPTIATGAPKQAALGIETVSKVARAVVADAQGLPVDVIVLDNPAPGGRVRVMMAPNSFDTAAVLSLVLHDQPTRLQPLDVVDSAADYLIANYFVREYGAPEALG